MGMEQVSVFGSVWFPLVGWEMARHCGAGLAVWQLLSWLAMRRYGDMAVSTKP
jgi:hypothetical protein